MKAIACGGGGGGVGCGGAELGQQTRLGHSVVWPPLRSAQSTTTPATSNAKLEASGAVQTNSNNNNDQTNSNQNKQMTGGAGSGSSSSSKKKKKKRKHSFDSIFSLDSELDEFDTQAVRFKPESLDNLVKLTKFNKRELKLMYRGFKQLCPSGVVKEDKFKLIYAQFFPRGAETNGYARFVFNTFDVQRKQEITFTDFVVGLSVLTRGTVDEQLRWIFTLYDINGDGIITRDELNRIVNSIHDLMGKFALTTGQAEVNRTGGISSSNINNHSNNNNSSSSVNQQATSGGHSSSAHNRQQLNSQQSITTNNQQLTNEDQAEQLFRKFDLNNDGIITLDEFLEACHKDDNIIKSISVFNTIL